MKRVVLFALTAALLLQTRAHTTAQTPDALSFFKNYFITGDYAAGGHQFVAARCERCRDRRYRRQRRS